MHRAAAITPTWEPRLVERRAKDNGNVLEVFEVAPGELVMVESGPTYTTDDLTRPEAPKAKQ
jgi:hypothetical protein